MRRATIHLVLALALLPPIPACKERYVEVSAPRARTLNESVGSGPSARDGNVVTVRYKLTDPKGRTVLEDNSYAFELGAGTVIGVVDDTVRGMRVGGRRVVECPPETHWGRAGYADKIEPNTVLKLDVQLLSVQ